MFENVGIYKNQFGSILKNSKNICKLLLGNNYESEFSNLDEELDKYIKQHLYVDDVVTGENSFIMYETDPDPTSPTMKNMKIIVQAICHKGIVSYKDKPNGYSGLRYDVLSGLIEEAICPNDEKKQKKITEKFGIGGFEIESTNLFLSKEFIGRTFILTVPEFR